MERVRLGRSSLEVTRLGLGTAPLGGLFEPVSDSDAEATIATAWSHGVRFFDTAPLYGFGLAEQRLGAFPRACAKAAEVASQIVRPSRLALIQSAFGTRTPEVVPFQVKTMSVAGSAFDRSGISP